MSQCHTSFFSSFSAFTCVRQQIMDCIGKQILSDLWLFLLLFGLLLYPQHIDIGAVSMFARNSEIQNRNLPRKLQSLALFLFLFRLFFLLFRLRLSGRASHNRSSKLLSLHLQWVGFKVSNTRTDSHILVTPQWGIQSSKSQNQKMPRSFPLVSSPLSFQPSPECTCASYMCKTLGT